MTEIRTALAAGLEVITHIDAVSVPGWSGVGYIILDPATGSGAFKIGGGRNECGLRRRKTGAIPGPASTPTRAGRNRPPSKQRRWPRVCGKPKPASGRYFFGRRPLYPWFVLELDLVRGPLLAIDPRRPAPTQRAGGLERGDPSVAHRHHRRLHQQPARLPGAVPIGGAGLDRADHGGAGQCPVPALRAGATDRRPLAHRVAVFAGLFAAIQLDRTLLEASEKMLLACPLFSHVSGLQKIHSPLHRNRACR